MMIKNVLLISTILLLLAGCRTIPQPVVEIQYRDREVEKILRDTVHVQDIEHVYTKGDTVYSVKTHVVYKERTRIDSVYVQDSIPYPVPTYVEKIVDKPPNKFQQVMVKWGITSAVLFLLVFLYKTKSFWKGIAGFLFKLIKF